MGDCLYLIHQLFNKTHGNMKTKQKTKIDNVEFAFNDGVHLVWRKESSGWSITRYKHGEQGRHILSVAHLPNLANALYFYNTLR